MKTPSDEIWPGVSALPEYKVTFPKWTACTLESQVKYMEREAVDLLKEMLVYDPAKRISAKRIMTHPYLEDVDTTIKPVLKSNRK